MRFLHVEVLECDLNDLVSASDERVEQAADVVLVRVRVVRTAECSVLLAVRGREHQTLATCNYATHRCHIRSPLLTRRNTGGQRLLCHGSK